MAAIEPETRRREAPTTEHGCDGATDDEPTMQETLTALSDPDCRAILEATREEPRTAGELTEACDLAESTAYRKVDELTDAGLLGERIRIRASGRHASEYVPALEDVTVSLAGEDGLEILFS